MQEKRSCLSKYVSHLAEADKNKMRKPKTKRSVIVGGGIIGLSLAYELAKRQREVVLLEQEGFGKKASWAGAGILPPTCRSTAIHPMEVLEAISSEVHELWAEELREMTGIDNGFRKCGGLYIARSAGEVAALTGMQFEWKSRGILFEELTVDEAWERLVFLNTNSRVRRDRIEPNISKALWVPSESQFSNPTHIAALVKACRNMGVTMCEHAGACQVQAAQGNVIGISAGKEKFVADQYFFTAGPWTEQLLKPLGVALPMQPVRGQIALYKVDLVSVGIDLPVINEGSRYLVPRTDGHVLAGATIEEAGFDCRTTESEVRELRHWAESFAGNLNDATFVRSWAGLRPATYDGFPYLGALGDSGAVFVATGHFKGGLHLSTATAVVLADLAEGKKTTIDLRPFSPARVTCHHSAEIK